MASAVMHPLAAKGGMRSKWRDGRSMGKVAGGFIKPNDRLTSFERLEIYNRQYWYRIKDPSQSFTLRNLGRLLVAFLETEPRWIVPLQQSALDMARLEWAHVEAFDNEARSPLEMDSLLGVDPTQIHLQLQPHLTLLQLRYELDEFLIKVKQGEGLRGEASNAMELHRVRKQSGLKRHLRPKTIFLAVHRHNNMVYYKRLQPAQFRLLSAFQAKATLAEACDELAEMAQADLTKFKSWFESWAALGWFCKLK